MQPKDPGHGSARTEVVDRLLQAFWTIGRAAKSTHAGGIDRGAQWILHLIGTHPGRLTHLATLSELDVSTVSRHVRQLEERGLVTRTPDPDDGRAHRVEASPAGGALLARVRDERRALIADRLAAWSQDDLETLTDLMSRLADEIAASQDAARKPA